MQFILNNSFNNTSLSKYLDMCMKPQASQMGQVSIYTNLPTTTTIKAVPSFVLFTNENYLKVINELNQKLYAGTVTLDAGITIPTLINTLSCSDATIRGKAIDYLVTKGICTLTTTEVLDAKRFTSTLIGFNYVNLSRVYDTVENAYVYSYTTPVELSSKYLSSDNTNNVALYLAFFPMFTYEFSGIPTENATTIFNCSKYYKPTTDSTVLQSTYIATKLSDITGDGDVKYDHLDVIEYLDDFRLRFRLPAIFS